MKIAIVTLPLLNNYGGILQNYAMQTVLKNMGYCAETLDFECKTIPLWRYVCSWVKSILFFFVPGHKRPFAKMIKKEKRSEIFDDFVTKYIEKTTYVNPFNVKLFCKNKYDAYVVGSDQVWRPRYAPSIKCSFLDFVKEKNVKRIAYATSFGVEKWEYTASQTRACASLIKRFDSISVREEAGLRLCKDYLNASAELTLDPTLLLDESDYRKLCDNIPQLEENVLVVYVLNMNDSIRAMYEKIAREKNLIVKIFSADSLATLSIPKWLAMFRDASYVVTDSFHGTVFSIIFGKEFKCIYNKTRGTARFETLLNLYNSGKLDEKRRFSLNWLKKALGS